MCTPKVQLYNVQNNLAPYKKTDVILANYKRRKHSRGTEPRSADDSSRQRDFPYLVQRFRFIPDSSGQTIDCEAYFVRQGVGALLEHKHNI